MFSYLLNSSCDASSLFQKILRGWVSVKAEKSGLLSFISRRCRWFYSSEPQPSATTQLMPWIQFAAHILTGPASMLPAAALMPPAPDFRRRAQLKLQGYFSRQDGHAGPSVPCSFCNDDLLETTEHMFLSCPRVHAMLDAVLLSACHETRLSVGSKLEHAEDVLPWVYAAGKLLRSKHERLC